MRTVLTLLVVAAIGTGGWFVYAMNTADPPSHFRTVVVKRGDVTSTISATGTMEAEDLLDVGAQVQGRIIDFGVDPSELKGRKLGDISPEEKAKLKRVDFNTVVHPGTLLASIDPAVYNAQFLQAEATLNRNIADLIQLKAKCEQAAAEWARAKRLRPDRAALEKDDPTTDGVAGVAAGTKTPAEKDAAEKKPVPAPEVAGSPEGKAPAGKAPGGPIKGLLDYRAMSDSDYDLARANYKVAKANVLVGEKTIEQSAAARDMAKTNLNYCTITSPIEGTIIARRVNIGQTVVASLSAPSIFLIAKDLKRMQIWASVNEADIGKIRSHKDMPVRFTTESCPGETFYGKVAQVRLNAQVTQNVVLYTVVVSVDNSDLRLIPYLTASLQFEVDQRNDVLLVPNLALRWNPRKEQIAPDVRDAVVAAAQSKGAGTRSGRGGGKTPSASQEGGPKPQRGQAAATEAPPSAAPADKTGAAKTAPSAKPAAGPTVRPQNGRVWIADDDYVRPVDVRIGVTDGTNTEVSGLTPEELKEGVQVVVGEIRGDQEGDTVENPFAPKLFRDRQKKKTD